MYTAADLRRVVSSAVLRMWHSVMSTCNGGGAQHLNAIPPCPSPRGELMQSVRCTYSRPIGLDAGLVDFLCLRAARRAWECHTQPTAVGVVCLTSRRFASSRLVNTCSSWVSCATLCKGNSVMWNYWGDLARRAASRRARNGAERGARTIPEMPCL